MQQQTGPSPSSNTSSFAGILAALADPESKRVPAWNDDDLEDDVATLSYECAVQTHARFRPDDPVVPLAPRQNADAGSMRIREVIPDDIGGETLAESPVVAQTRPTAVARLREANSGRERNLKCASITIRLSQTECAQLRTRAAGAGLSVSAYLRSCTFEAEALRSQVKEALAHLRPAEPLGQTQESSPGKRSWFHWPSRNPS